MVDRNNINEAADIYDSDDILADELKVEFRNEDFDELTRVFLSIVGHIRRV